MRTQFVTPDTYAAEFLSIIQENDLTNGRRPERFLKIMKENRGIISQFSPFEPQKDGLEPKNPVIVALGDSVTAGHFEFTGNPEELFKRADKGELKENEAIEITDARECYLEKFRLLLIDEFEQTSVSAINAGIAGDNMTGMERRLERDVIRYQPELVLINGSLNWDEGCGDTAAYERVFTAVVTAVKEKTQADIILMTPNMERPGSFSNPISTLAERVEVIRQVAACEKVGLADTYRAWKLYQDKGLPLEALLANGMNHPSAVGHQGYALALMQLIKTSKRSLS